MRPMRKWLKKQLHSIWPAAGDNSGCKKSKTGFIYILVLLCRFISNWLCSVEDVGLQFSSPGGYLRLEQNCANRSQNSPVDPAAMVTNECRRVGVRWWYGRCPDQLAVQGGGGEVCAAVVEERDEGMEGRLQRRTSFTAETRSVGRWERHNSLLQHLQVIVCAGCLIIHM